MWHWVKRWRDWLMNDQIPLYRLRSQSQGLHVSYEKAGLTLHHSAIPWNAECLVVESLLKLPATGRRKNDFTMRLGDAAAVPPESLRRSDIDGQYRLFFRFPTPSASTEVRLYWRDHELGRAAVRIVPRDAYLRDFRLLTPTVSVRIGDELVAAQTFVSSQCRGLFATAQIANAGGLASLVDLGLCVQFRSERDGVVEEVPIRLSSSQLAGKEALVSATPKQAPRRIGTWSVNWLLDGQILASRQIRAISQRAFQKSLRISDSRFLVTRSEGVQVQRQVPTLTEVKRLGPCFLICSSEAGMAGLCHLEVRGHLTTDMQSPPLMEQTLLVSDGPSLFSPGTLDVAELQHLTGFELILNGTPLGSLSLRPVPRASFNTEGGYKPPPDFAWSNLADEELNERLSRLIG